MKSLTKLSAMVRGWFHRLTHASGGFTLIELLVVVAIMGVLAAVAIPNIARFAGRGANEARRTELQNVQTATDAWLAEVRIDPSTNPLVGNIGGAAIRDFSNIGALDDTGSVVSGPQALYPDFIRLPFSWGADNNNDGVIDPVDAGDVGYCWDSNGRVTQVVSTQAGVLPSC